VQPWVRKYNVTFPVAVDSTDVLGTAFGLKAIPVSFLVDEVGIVRLKGGGPSKEFLSQVEALLAEPVSSVRGQSQPSLALESAATLRTRLERQGDDAQTRLAFALALQREGRFDQALAESATAARLRPEDSAILFAHGGLLLANRQTAAALVEFKRARDLDPENWRIRKQIWAIEHPDKFYGSSGIDWGWQKEQIAREQK